MFPPATCWPNISQSKEKTSLRANLTKIWRLIFQKFFENVENILILDWKPQLSFPRRGQLGLVRSLHHFQLPPRVLLEGWPISIFALRKWQKIMTSVRKCISTQIHTVCRDQVRMSTVARSLGRGRQNVLRCREHLLPAGVVFNLRTFWEKNSRWWTRYEQRKWFPNVIARRTVSGRHKSFPFVYQPLRGRVGYIPTIPIVS